MLGKPYPSGTERREGSRAVPLCSMGHLGIPTPCTATPSAGDVAVVAVCARHSLQEQGTVLAPFSLYRPRLIFGVWVHLLDSLLTS